MVSALYKSEVTKTNILLNNYNARLCKLTPIIPENEKYNDNNELSSVDYGDITFSLGQVIDSGKIKFKIQKIKKLENGEYGPGYYLYSHLLNYSSNFIAPMLGYSREFFRWDKEFCNCFVGTEFMGDYGNSIYLLYRFNGSQDYLNMEAALTSFETFEEMYEVDSYHTLYQFQIPADYIADYEMILDSKYSYISESYKKQILDFHKERTKGALYQVLYRTDERKRKLEKDLSNPDSPVIIPEGQDLLDIFREDKEVYLNKYQLNGTRKREETKSDS